VSSTNMTCLTPHDRNEKGSFLAANLYAKRWVVSDLTALRC
jgi:coatomer subunit beta